MNKEIIKYKKRLAIFRLVGVFSALASLIYLVCAIFLEDGFFINCIISCSLLGLVVIIFLIFGALFDKKLKYLSDKYFGKVSEEDKIIATSLLEEIKSLNENSLKLLKRSDIVPKSIKWLLKIIIAGRKISEVSLTAFKEDFKELTEDNVFAKDYAEVRDYLSKVLGLLERNSYSL